MYEPRIYVADLASYNSGYLHGVWIYASEELEVIWEQINAMLANSPIANSEEWAVHDYEGFGGYQVSEYKSIASLNEIALFIEEHEQLGTLLLTNFYDLDEARKTMEENYHGCYASLADYAQAFTEETTDIPTTLEYYIDYEKMGKDWEMPGDIFTIETAHDEVHIFSNV